MASDPTPAGRDGETAPAPERLTPDGHHDEPGRRAGLAGLAFILVLLVLGLLLVRALYRESVREDCLVARMRTCDAPVAAQPQ